MLESEIPTIECTNVTDRQNTYSLIRGSRVQLKLKYVYMVYYSFVLSYIEPVFLRPLPGLRRNQPVDTPRIYTLLWSEISHKSHPELNANADSDGP